MAVIPEPRRYLLSPLEDDCGSRRYSGTRIDPDGEGRTDRAFVSISISSLSRSVRCSTRAASTLYVTRTIGLNEASSCRRPMGPACSSNDGRCVAGR